MTGGDQVLPFVPPTAMLGNDVVDGEVAAAAPAVLARVPVPGEDLAPRELHAGARPLHQVHQADDRRRRDRHARRVDDLVIPLEELGLVRTEQVEGAPDVADVERLVVLIENQHRSVEHALPPGRDDTGRAEHAFAWCQERGRRGPRVQCGTFMTTITTSTWATKVGLARMLAGGVIMDVVTADHARIAEE